MDNRKQLAVIKLCIRKGQAHSFIEWISNYAKKYREIVNLHPEYSCFKIEKNLIGGEL